VTETPATGVGDTSRESIERLHRGHVEAARRRFVACASVLLAAFVLWVIVDRAQLGSVTFLIVGAALYFTFLSGVDWRQKRRMDPHAATFDAAAYAAADAEFEQHRARLAAYPARVTYGLMALLLAVSVVQALVSRTNDVRDALAAAGLVKDAVRRGEWWRLLTGTFLHDSIWHPHLWMNLAALWTLGQVVEAYAPRMHVFLIYLVAAITGSLFSLVAAPHTDSIGASGAIMGLAGYLLVLAWRRPHDVPPWLTKGVLTTFGLTAYIGVFGFRFVDNAAHLGGAIGGALVGLLTIAPTNAPVRARRWSLSTMAGVGAAAVLVAGAGLTARQVIRTRAGVGPETAAIVPLTSVRLRVVTSTASVRIVEIENLRNVPLEAWTIAAVSRGVPPVVLANALTDVCCVETEKPIPPRGTRREDVSWVTRLPAGAQLAPVAALFSDGSFEGRPADRDAILSHRNQQAEDLAYEIQVITEARGQPSSRAGAFLAERAESRARQAQSLHRPVAVNNLVALARSASSAPSEFDASAHAMLDRLTKQREALLGRGQH
jgi:membrane associated rhomboid family serine protease